MADYNLKHIYYFCSIVFICLQKNKILVDIFHMRTIIVLNIDNCSQECSCFYYNVLSGVDVDWRVGMF